MKTILTCALTGGADTAHLSQAIPVTPQDIAQQGIDAIRAGAAILHIHVRDPETGKQSVQLAHYQEVVERIRDSGTDAVINLTTGPGSRWVPGDNPTVAGADSSMMSAEQRVEHILALKPEVCSLDIATLNFGKHVMINHARDVCQMAALVEGAGVRTEIEVFDFGNLREALHLIEEKRIPAPSHFQFCLGVPWGAPASTEVMSLMKTQLAGRHPWSAFGISHAQFPMVAQGVVLGGHVRVGLEDNLYLKRGKLAPHNAALVERARVLVEAVGSELATPAEARQILRLGRI
ncbi:3-keto-5-aminohexanoate cleavage protein [Pseudacidovorax sp. RU35E]|uniref:3-keto-5-aminohexanoate cleavage protein n=1 Tax=Pseudacidovorax sp. RU35E TaxID=1907403 RepID=UPI000955BFEB|nr:3-keto-5-aminohexanoate cleavage protein [Pseudacidovorax sp. RU35E]SIR76613.1 Uncharacterized conserved protein, DUF849 family [Pseudacidovorax sp. RU35E]